MARHARSATPPAEEVIQDLARNTQQPLDRVRNVYEEQLAILGAEAKVTVFLSVLAKRRAKEVLTRAR